MSDMTAVLSGQCSPWPSKEALLHHLRNGGLRVSEGRYSVRVEECEHFVFQHLGGDITDPTIDADAESSERLYRDACLVSSALTKAGIKHRFEVYDSNDSLVHYLHFEWPPTSEA